MWKNRQTEFQAGKTKNALLLKAGRQQPYTVAVHIYILMKNSDIIDRQKWALYTKTAVSAATL